MNNKGADSPLCYSLSEKHNKYTYYIMYIQISKFWLVSVPEQMGFSLPDQKCRRHASHDEAHNTYSLKSNLV